MSPKDGPQKPLNDASDLLVKQEDLFKDPVKGMNAVFEIDLVDRRIRIGAGESEGRTRIELDIGLIGEKPI